ncbi:MAG: type II toxin-antitoxin system RelE/ParE family toxin [Nitrospirota bacterium]
MKNYKVFWTDEAALDLNDIIDYISQDKLSAAVSVYKAIRSKCLSLKNNPERYRIVPELLALGISNYREIVHSPYRVIYKLSDFSVYIIAVVDSRRDFETFIYNRILRRKPPRCSQGNIRSYNS